MANSGKLRAPRGMPDILPDEIAMIRHIEETAHRVFGLYGYDEIRTPLFEETRLFVRGIGEASDIVEKEMYTFAESDDSITLRPEATASVVRAAIEHDLLKKRGFWKLYYVGPMFRKERPQAGRLRQFDQIGVEALGSPAPSVDAETILLAARFFLEVGLPGVETKINTIGCPVCRSDYRNALRDILAPRLPELCDDCRARFDRNVFRILDCKNRACKAIAMDTPPMRDYLDADCREHFESVCALLKNAQLDFRVDDHLVRGFDYYTRTVFELAHPSLGARDAVCGGGRYDNLVAEFGGPDAGCVGFAIGVVPLVLALKKAAGEAVAQPAPLQVYVVAVNADVRGECFSLVNKLRLDGISAELDHEGRSLKAQMRSANRLAAQHTLVIGPDELANGEFKLKEMETGREETLPFDGIVRRLKADPS